MYYEGYTCYYISAIEISYKNTGKLSSGGRGRKFTKRTAFWTPKAPFRVTIALRRFESHLLTPTIFSFPFQSLSGPPAQALSFAGASLWEFCGDCLIPFPTVDRIDMCTENAI